MGVPAELPPRCLLAIEPDIIKAPVVVDAVLMQHEILDVGLPTKARYVLQDDGPGDVFGELLLDLPNEPPAPCQCRSRAIVARSVCRLPDCNISCSCAPNRKRSFRRNSRRDHRCRRRSG